MPLNTLSSGLGCSLLKSSSMESDRTFCRDLRLYLYRPLPIATMVSDEFSSIAFRFFQSYMAVLLQGLVILLIVFTYLAIARAWIIEQGIVDNTFGLIRYLLSSLALLLMLLKSEGWARALVGL